MRYVLALAACCALVSVPFALASEGDATQPQATVSTPCTRLKNVYAERRWREAKPARGENVCPADRKTGAQNTIHHFYLYRAFRRVAPYSGYEGRGVWLTYLAVPRYITDCESGSWDGYNPSGAVGPAQVMQSWGVPWPIRTAEEKVRYWKITASIWDGGSGASNWVCAG